MQENELKVLLSAAATLGINPNELRPQNPYTFSGPRAESIQLAVSQIDPAQAARWRVEAGQGLSLGAAAARAGITEMSRAQHEELLTLDPDYSAGVSEAAGRREAELLASLEQGAEKLRETRERQSQQFQRQAGSNTAGGQYTRQFVQRWGDVKQQQKTPARRMLGK